MASRQPLQIYLDSQDYSRLSDPRTRAQFQWVEKELLGLRDAGLIEIRYSFVHVAEIAPIAPTHLDFARYRADCITRLCGPKTLLHHSDLAAAEARAVAELAPLKREEVQRNDGYWMPTLAPEDYDFPPIDELVQRFLTGGSGLPLSTSAWAQIRQRCFNSDGSLHLEARLAILSRMPELIKEFGTKYPLSDDAVTAIQTYLSGGITRPVIQELLINSTKDIRRFIEWYAINWDQVSPLTEWVRRSGSEHAEKITRARKSVEQIFDEQRSQGDDNRTIMSKARMEMRSIRESDLPDFFGPLIPGKRLPDW